MITEIYNNIKYIFYICIVKRNVIVACNSRESKAYVRRYYMLVRKVHRVANKDKHGNVTSYGTYTATTDSNQSGYF